MKISHLLLHRESLLRQARLANLAYAYSHMEKLVQRITAARLCGMVCVHPAASDREQGWPSLVALDGNQSVLEEHFTDENIVDLADLVGFLSGDPAASLSFRLEEMREQLLLPLRRQLEGEGIRFEPGSLPLAETNESDRSGTAPNGDTEQFG